jgi:hypothetical protein
MWSSEWIGEFVAKPQNRSITIDPSQAIRHGGTLHGRRMLAF